MLLSDANARQDNTAATMTEAEGTSTTSFPRFYPIGTPGTPWGDSERQEWKASVKKQRSYETHVLTALKALDKDIFDIQKYGALSHNPDEYPLWLARSKTSWTSQHADGKEAISLLVTGGVHGYETSGVLGALKFLKERAPDYIKQGINILVAPCVSPWAFEHIQRWQAELLDPNRSFHPNDPSQQTEESKALIQYLQNNLPGDMKFTIHLDLHETTDTDETEFMPAKHAAAGLNYEGETIPDGFYLVGDNENPQLEFQTAVIENVRKVTHIAPPDDKGCIIDEPLAAEGIIIVPAVKLGLCCSLTRGQYVTTTEVYPDSPNVTDEDCNDAQVAAIVGALEFVLKAKKQ